MNMNDLAKVVAVTPNAIEIEVSSTAAYADLEEKIQIGSYLEISDDMDSKLIAVVQGFRIKDAIGAEDAPTGPKFVLSLQPVGRLENGTFMRGGKQITIPPQNVSIAGKDLLEKIYSSVEAADRFSFGTLVQDESVRVALHGDRFFGKHIGVVGSTGSGKSSTVAAILQEGLRAGDGERAPGVLNNSHVIIFDIHGEYAPAFPDAHVIGAEEIKLPYWLMNAEELEEMFIESNEQNSHNQVSQFRGAVIANKQKNNPGISPARVSYDSPVYFSLEEVTRYLDNLNSETISRVNGENAPKSKVDGLISNRERLYFDRKVDFVEQSAAAATKATAGPFAGEFNRFLMRLEGRKNDHRLDFLLAPENVEGVEYKTDDLSDLIAQFMGYGDDRSNITIIDLSGIPFDVLSVVVSLITRLVFTFSFHFKKLHAKDGLELPYLLVYEEAHNYIPQSEGAKYGSVKRAIERVAKEGRKYGISLMIVSQRPSEISETVFSQCNNFVAMRLTNPNDQRYVKRLLPDNLSAITDSLASLEQREAILIGDAVALPSLTRIDEITDRPASNDVKFHKEWKKDWFDDAFAGVVERWRD
ncbi:ATP-binding protein [Curtobacterium sp. MCLR17_031]|uniref:ATP-binding protein n=1 Tax=Curtobacterium sp. MCLR17_031 TaxID=2175622 RepID=UPI000DA7BB0A|nr:ATP-binding protein [Curtobacterium sp. MCLR17_031]WIE57554.1 ATP-binding protein [Curtobacterium sp. MCLR17_031]